MLWSRLLRRIDNATAPKGVWRHADSLGQSCNDDVGRIVVIDALRRVGMSSDSSGVSWMPITATSRGLVATGLRLGASTL